MDVKGTRGGPGCQSRFVVSSARRMAQDDARCFGCGGPCDAKVLYYYRAKGKWVCLVILQSLFLLSSACRIQTGGGANGFSARLSTRGLGATIIIEAVGNLVQGCGKRDGKLVKNEDVLP